uniref:RING-type E3 ubiquitin transferase n=1 Tax=Kalanchoe fedtschenkoi TaxID=63787 RepID=A0A7N1A5E2_KALFE
MKLTRQFFRNQNRPLETLSFPLYLRLSRIDLGSENRFQFRESETLRRMSRSTHQADPPNDPNGPIDDSLFSPGFKSVAAMAGWDEEAILIASLVVDDTPERELKQKKRPELRLKTPPGNSRRKRRSQRRSPIPATVLNLDEEEDNAAEKPASAVEEKTETRKGEHVQKQMKKIEEASGRSSEAAAASSPKADIPCMEKLREELSCAICLEICYEPSTTPCGHSFCKKCLRSSADKCGKKCPKCRQLIGNGRSCAVNTVLWNTIQLLFGKEIEARKRVAEGSMKSPDSGKRARVRDQHIRSPTFRAIRMSTDASPTFRPARFSNRRARSAAENAAQESQSFRFGRTRGHVGGGRRGGGAPVPSQAEDAALALRLQREEFMAVFRGENGSGMAAAARANLRAMGVGVAGRGEYESSVTAARANLRAMASRALSLRDSRGGP